MDEYGGKSNNGDAGVDCNRPADHGSVDVITICTDVNIDNQLMPSTTTATPRTTATTSTVAVAALDDDFIAVL